MIKKVNIPEGTKGEFFIKRFEVKEPCIRSMIQGRNVPPGYYTKLCKGYGENVIMSDTPAEFRDHMWIIHNGRGNVLVAGLGIGLVFENLAMSNKVEHITVVEKEKDVIDLVWPHYKKYHGKSTLIHDDIFNVKFPKGTFFDYAWYDIWDDICADNLPEMHKLHRKFGRVTGNQGSWSRDLCERYRVQGY